MMSETGERDAGGWAAYARLSVCDQNPELWLDEACLVLPTVDEHADPDTATACPYSGQPFAAVLGPRCPMCGWTMTVEGHPARLFVPLALDHSDPPTRFGTPKTYSPIQRMEHQPTGTIITDMVTDQWGHTAAVVTNPCHPDVNLGPSQSAARDLIRRLASHLPGLIAGQLLGDNNARREYEEWMLTAWATIATPDALSEAAGHHVLREPWRIERPTSAEWISGEELR